MDQHQSPGVLRHLHGVTYPATRDELIASAESHGADEDVLHRLRNIEPGSYDSPEAVTAAYTYLGETGTGYGHVTVYDQ